MRIRGKFTILVAVLLVATLLIFLVSYQVRINEAAIVYTFSKAGALIDTPGLHWKLPYPIQTVIKYDKRTHIFEGKFQEYLTKDQHNLIVSIAVGWAIQEPRTFQERVGGGDAGGAEDKLNGLVGGAANAIINSYDLNEFITASPDPKQFKYTEIEAKIYDAVAGEALKQYGLGLSFIRITKLGLPEDVTTQVFARIRAEREATAKGIRAQGDSRAETIKADADQQRQDILTKAEAEARVIRGTGDKEAAEHYAVFKKDPVLAAFLRNLDALERLKRRTTVILTPESPPYNLLGPNVAIPGAKAVVPEPPEKKAPEAPGK